MSRVRELIAESMMASVGGARDKRLVARHIYQVIRYLVANGSKYKMDWGSKCFSL